MTTAAELLSMSDDQLDASDYRRLRLKHLEAFHALMVGACDHRCLAATDMEQCTCRCGGAFHGHLWADEIIQWDDSESEDAWQVFWSSPEQIERDRGWGHAQRTDQSRIFGSRDAAEAFMRSIAPLLGDQAEVFALPVDYDY